MQIFVTDPRPYESAMFLWGNPTRARKMITESMQIMACALEHFGCKDQLKKANGEPYATPKSRMNHPIVKWVCEDKKHLAWLHFHCRSLYVEYRKRKGQAFENVPKNLSIVFDLVEFDCEEINNLTFLNFAKCKSKELDFTQLPVFEAYKKYINIQEGK